MEERKNVRSEPSLILLQGVVKVWDSGFGMRESFGSTEEVVVEAMITCEVYIVLDLRDLGWSSDCLQRKWLQGCRSLMYGVM